MPRANAGNPTNPRKRAANPPPPITANEHQQQLQQWQPDLPCKFHQLPNALIMEILSRLPFNTLFNCRVQGGRKWDKPSAEGSSGCAGSGMPPHKSAKLDSGHDLPTLEEGLPRATSSAVSPEFSWRIGTACTLCGGDLGYLFRGKGFPTCQQCFDAGSTRKLFSYEVCSWW